MSDDTDSNVFHLPTRDSDSVPIPDAPDAGDLFYSEPSNAGEGSGVPPESPEGATIQLPTIPAPPDPVAALRADGITGPDNAPGDGSGGNNDGEYVHRRSLADRIGDWLEYRIELGRTRLESEKPFREAEIARKVAILKNRTDGELALKEQRNKLRQAELKARTGRVSAGGSAAGMGADHGRNKFSPSGGRGPGSNSGGRGGGLSGGGGSGSGGRGSGGSGGQRTGSNTSGGANSPKGGGKGSGGSSGGRNGASGGKESKGSPKDRQHGSGGSSGGRSGKQQGSGGGWGSKDSGGSGGGLTGSHGSPEAGRHRPRHERAAARQAARLERRGARHAAGLADRTADRAQNRDHKQVEWEDHRAAKADRKAARRERAAERKAKRKAKREAAAAAAAAEDRTTFGEALVDEARRRWEERRAQAEKDDAEKRRAKDEIPEQDSGEAPETADGDGSKDTPDGAEKPSDDPEADPSKQDKDSDDDGKPSDGDNEHQTDDASGAGRPEDGPAKDKPGDREDEEEEGEFDETLWDAIKERLRASQWNWGKGWSWTHWNFPWGNARPAEDKPGPIRPEDAGFRVYRRGRYKPGDPLDDGMELAPGPKSLPPAPEPHTQRPGTSRPTATAPQQEEDNSVSSAHVASHAPGQLELIRQYLGLARQHQTDITFDEYLIEMTNIAINAERCRERAEDLSLMLGKIADGLIDMARVLSDDHNIDTGFIDLLTELADAAELMKKLAEQCASACAMAAEAALLAAKEVARVYSEDLEAMRAGGLKYASAAAHHE